MTLQYPQLPNVPYLCTIYTILSFFSFTVLRTFHPNLSTPFPQTIKQARLIYGASPSISLPLCQLRYLHNYQCVSHIPNIARKWVGDLSRYLPTSLLYQSIYLPTYQSPPIYVSIHSRSSRTARCKIEWFSVYLPYHCCVFGAQSTCSSTVNADAVIKESGLGGGWSVSQSLVVSSVQHLSTTTADLVFVESRTHWCARREEVGG
jgi:hypothetical protein